MFNWLEKKELASRSFRSMGGLATITLGASYRERIESITAQIEALFEQLENALSSYRPQSAVNQLARAAGVAPVAVSDHVSRVLALGKHFGELSNGAFDITMSPLVKLWGFAQEPEIGAVPSPEAIAERLRFVDYRRLILAEGTAYLSAHRMAVDVGGIAKGYAVDCAFDFCRSSGIQDFLIDLSGNVRASGRPYGRTKWQVGVRDPYDRSALLGAITVPENGALATSGSYERFIEVQGARYSHIINPRTGLPVTGTAAVTVLAPDAATADGLSTPLFIAGLGSAGELLTKAPGCQALIVPDKYPTQIWLTSGLAQIFVAVPQMAKSCRFLRENPGLRPDGV